MVSWRLCLKILFKTKSSYHVNTVYHELRKGSVSLTGMRFNDTLLRCC